MSTGEPDFYSLTVSSGIKLIVSEGRGAFVFRDDAQAKAVRDALCDAYGLPEGCATIAKGSGQFEKDLKIAIDQGPKLKAERDAALAELELARTDLSEVSRRVVELENQLDKEQRVNRGCATAGEFNWIRKERDAAAGQVARLLQENRRLDAKLDAVAEALAGGES